MAIKERKNVGPSGMAQVSFLTRSVRVSFENGDTYDLPLDGVEAGRKSGKYRVDMTADKTKAYLHPVDGQYMFKFKQMGNRTVGASQGKPGLPTNKMTEARIGHRKDGGAFPIPRELIFTAQFTIESEGLYKGMVVTTNLPYAFTAPQTGIAPVFFDSRHNLKRLETFFQVAGNISIAMDETIPFAFSPEPTTQLLAVEKALQKADRLFLGDVEKGFLNIDDIREVPADLLAAPKKTRAPRKPKAEKVAEAA